MDAGIFNLENLIMNLDGTWLTIISWVFGGCVGYGVIWTKVQTQARELEALWKERRDSEKTRIKLVTTVEQIKTDVAWIKHEMDSAPDSQ